MPLKDPKKKGKPKKKKISKDRKERADLEKAADAIKDNYVVFKTLILRAEKWVEKRGMLLCNLLCLFDPYHTGNISYAEFKSGLLDLLAPFNNAEIFLLSTLLDQNLMERVSYLDILLHLQTAKEALINGEEIKQEQRSMEATERKFEHCRQCDLALYEPKRNLTPTYFSLEMRHIHTHKHHTRFIFTAQALVQMLINKLAHDYDIASNNISIFKDASKSPDAMLPMDMTLEECGYPGGKYIEPVALTLYYDYAVECSDSPILLSDDFFMYKIRKKTFMFQEPELYEPVGAKVQQVESTI